MTEITFVSDYVCPYCLVGKEALRQAIEETGIEACVTFQPIEITEETEPRVDTYHDPVRRKRYEQILTRECLGRLGLEDMKIPPKVIPRPYTRLAYEGWLFAKEHGKGEEYNDLMYRAYFMEELDIGEIEVLAALAKRLGLPGEEFKIALETGRYTAEEKKLVQYAKERLEITTLPLVIINGQAKGFQKYSREEAVAMLKGKNALEEVSAAGCGVDGCR